jgi:hypothetical protein
MADIKISSKIKTTILMDKTLKKLAQVYAIQNDMCLGEVIEVALRHEILEREGKKR